MLATEGEYQELIITSKMNIYRYIHSTNMPLTLRTRQAYVKCLHKVSVTAGRAFTNVMHMHQTASPNTTTPPTHQPTNPPPPTKNLAISHQPLLSPSLTAQHMLHSRSSTLRPTKPNQASTTVPAVDDNHEWVSLDRARTTPAVQLDLGC